MWFYHKVPLEGSSGTHPLVVKEIGFLPEQPLSVEVYEGTEEANAHVAMLREVSKLFSTRDIVEEYVACKCFPVRGGWSITSWAGKEKRVGGLAMPNFSTSFGIMKDGKPLALPSLFFYLLFAYFAQGLIPSPYRFLRMKPLGPRL